MLAVSETLARSCPTETALGKIEALEMDGGVKIADATSGARESWKDNLDKAQIRVPVEATE